VQDELALVDELIRKLERLAGLSEE